MSRQVKTVHSRAWFLHEQLFEIVDEDSYASVRQRLEQSKGVETKVKLSKKGLKVGGDRNVPRKVYPLNDVLAIEQDTIYSNVVLCVLRNNPSKGFQYAIHAFKFNDGNGPAQLHECFESLKGNVANCTTTAQNGKLPGGRPSAAVGPALAPDRWAAKDRATPKVFIAHSMEDLTAEEQQHSYQNGTADSDDLDDVDLQGTDEVVPFGTIISADVALKKKKEASEDRESSTRRTSNGGSASDVEGVQPRYVISGKVETKRKKKQVETSDVGVTVRFPAATDPKTRRHRMDVARETPTGSVDNLVVESCEVACQVDLPRKKREGEVKETKKKKVPTATLR